MEFELRPDIAIIKDDDGKIITEAPSDMVARSYFAGGGVELGLLPPAVRWVSSDGLGVVLERPPQLVTIRYEYEKYTIPVPWTVWGIRFNKRTTPEKCFLFARPYPLSTMGDELFVLPLPNMAKDSEITMPDNDSGFIGEKLIPMVEDFWSRPFSNKNTLLEDATLVPDEWKAHVKEGVNKYLVFLATLDVESVTFADLKTGRFNTLESLVKELETAQQVDQPKTTMEFFYNLVKHARGG